MRKVVLSLITLLVIASFLTACATPTPQVVKEVQTQVVKDVQTQVV